MATYTLISSNVLSSSAASVTFSAIPATFTDLVVRFSTRADTSNQINLTVNATSGGTAYSWTRLRGNGSTAASGNSSSDSSFALPAASVETSGTANTFSSGEVYIPSYTASQYKPMSSFNTQEDNSTTSFINVNAGLYSANTAISEIKLAAASGNFVSGSSFYLYGISNA
jgi:hypothetical protein